MTLAKRSMAMVGGMGLVVALAVIPTRAQDPVKPKADEPATTVKKKYDPARRVPDYFGQVALTPEQREAIYKIRKTHQEKIDALKKQIDELEAKSLEECEAKLTDTQKKLLNNLRSNGARGAKPAETVEKK